MIDRKTDIFEINGIGNFFYRHDVLVFFKSTDHPQELLLNSTGQQNKAVIFRYFRVNFFS